MYMKTKLCSYFSELLHCLGSMRWSGAGNHPPEVWLFGGSRIRFQYLWMLERFLKQNRHTLENKVIKHGNNTFTEPNTKAVFVSKI